MSKKTFQRFLFCLSLLFLLRPVPSQAQTNGIFADFSTSMGSFTCSLFYATAPKSVANFIGLATGQRPWLDLTSGRMRTNPFYNGITFHRVVSNFVDQAGSPNGLGTDGPGYVYPDEISSALRFTNSGVLAMANTGTNSNGSQFFLTVTSTPFLNDGYTIFGHLVGGTNVMLAINRVAVDANSKPLTNVYIQSIGIRRVGSAAQAFDINAQTLPLVTNLPVKIANGSAQVALSFSNRLYVDNQLYSSTNLSTWSGSPLGIEIASPVTNNFYVSKDVSKRFFSIAQIQYLTNTFAPKTVTNRMLTLNFSGGLGTVAISFNATNGGTYTYTSGTSSTGTITGYTWIQEPYRGRLWPIYYSGLVTMTLNLNCLSNTNGTIAGTAYTSPSEAVSGSWTMH